MYAAAGVGVLGIGMGTYFGFRSSSLRGDADKLAEQCVTPCLKSNPLAPQITSKDNSARSTQTAAAVSFVFGGVGVATAVTLFVLGKRKPAKSAYSVAPFIGPGSAGLHGTW